MPGTGIATGIAWRKGKRGGSPAPVGPVVATGGDSVKDVSIDGTTYRIHTFLSSDDFVVTSGGAIEYLIVAGGGSGGAGGLNGNAGGGGGGGLIQASGTVTSGSHAVTIGAGGVGSQDVTVYGTNGEHSEFLNQTAKGGGTGGNFAAGFTDGVDGGSGGGATVDSAGGTGTPGQGNDGALNRGGGGGFLSPGLEGTSTLGGVGGDGLITDFDGTSKSYAAGGSGVSDANIAPPASGWTGTGVNAAPNTGGGGIGNRLLGERRGGDGGSGKVIIRYPI